MLADNLKASKCIRLIPGKVNWWYRAELLFTYCLMPCNHCKQKTPVLGIKCTGVQKGLLGSCYDNKHDSYGGQLPQPFGGALGVKPERILTLHDAAMSLLVTLQHCVMPVSGVLLLQLPRVLHQSLAVSQMICAVSILKFYLDKTISKGRCIFFLYQNELE